MKTYYDRGRKDQEYAVGDMVYLKIQPYHHSTLHCPTNQYLTTLFYGLFKILERIGKVAYCLELPEGVIIHPVFYVSKLKARVGTSNLLSLVN